MNFFKTSILSVGAFAMGIAFEKRYKLLAETPNLPDLSNSGDVIDGQIHPAKSPVNQNNVPLITKHGVPPFDHVRQYPNFLVSYDRRNRVANWVLEHLTPEHLNSKEYDRSNIEFYEDKSFHHFFRATNSDYKYSGYDRGHLAAAGNYRSNPDHIKETYVLTNIAPQVGKGFNRDKWNQLEKYCRKKVRESNNTWICTGPLYLPRRDPSNGKMYVKYEVIGNNHVSVPTHFFKLILCEKNGKYHLESFLMPNEPIDNSKNLKDFRINPEVIERASGFIFFNKIPKHILTINSN